MTSAGLSRARDLLPMVPNQRISIGVRLDQTWIKVFAQGASRTPPHESSGWGARSTPAGTNIPYKRAEDQFMQRSEPGPTLSAGSVIRPGAYVSI